MCRHTDMVISTLFGILGWKLSSDKLIDYGTMCKVLGVEFNLRMAGEGLFATQMSESVSSSNLATSYPVVNLESRMEND